MTKKIYQLHRRLSIIIAIPVFLWAASGFMHPLMTNIRPAIATQGFPALRVDSSRLRVSLAEALRMRHIDSFANVRLVHIDTNWFYQVMPALHGGVVSPAIQSRVPVYLSCTNGNALPAGDWLYAQYLARYFLEGRTSQAAAPASAMPDMPDCCGAATECVLNPKRGAKVGNVSMLSAYDKEYKSINRLLPVYRVSFERADGIRVYVETTQDRFSFAMDNKRAVFDEIFRIFHTWGWLDALGPFRLFVVFAVAALAFFTVLLGVYLFFTTRAAKAKGNPVVRRRRNHRYTAIVASLFTLFWTFSGAYHAFTQLVTEEEKSWPATANFATVDAGLDWGRLQGAVGDGITNIGLAKIGGRSYWRVSEEGGGGGKGANTQDGWHKDLMKDGKAAFTPVQYVSVEDYSVLPDGDQRYAASLADHYSRAAASTALSVKPVTAFNDEYNFTDKRLPVWRVSYPGAGHPRYFVETSSGQLAAFMNSAAYAEGYSFSVFHKHHFMDWGGKTVRDGSTMFWALVQLLMISFGLILYFRFRK